MMYVRQAHQLKRETRETERRTRGGALLAYTLRIIYWHWIYLKLCYTERYIPLTPNLVAVPSFSFSFFFSASPSSSTSSFSSIYIKGFIFLALLPFLLSAPALFTSFSQLTIVCSCWMYRVLLTYSARCSRSCSPDHTRGIEHRASYNSQLRENISVQDSESWYLRLLESLGWDKADMPYLSRRYIITTTSLFKQLRGDCLINY